MASFLLRLRDAAVAGSVQLLLALIRCLPADSAMRLGAASGRLWARLGLPRTSVARVNLRIAFPEWSEAARRAVLERAFANLGRVLVEGASLDRLPAQQLQRVVRVEGIEHLEAARRVSPHGGAIALTAHFGNWELFLVAMAAHGVPLTLVHRERTNPGLEKMLGARRGRLGTEMLARGSAARGTLRALRAGRVVAMTLDQDTPREEGIFVPFFSRLACTRDAPARIAMRTGAPVVPVFVFRDGESAEHVARFRPALILETGNGRSQQATRENVFRMTREIEAAIRQSPDQWTWSHRRWKTQPPGEVRPYPSRRRLLRRLRRWGDRRGQRSSAE